MTTFATPSNIRDRDNRFRLSKDVTPGTSLPSGVTVTRTGVGAHRQTIVTFTNALITMTGLTTAGGHNGGTKLFDWPEAVIRLLGISYSLTMTAGSGGISDTAALVWGIGTAAMGVDNATLLTTEADLVPSVAATLVGGVKASTGTSVGAQITSLTDNSGGTASDTLAAITGSYVEATIENTVATLAAKINELVTKANTSQATRLDGTSAAKSAYLNIAVPDAGFTDSTTDTIAITGSIIFTWINEGDVAA